MEGISEMGCLLFLYKMNELSIFKPTLVINEAICKNNIKQMAEKAREHHLIFRPHFKTHFSAEIGEWFRDQGVSCITVSSVQMAEYFASHGWEDIAIAFPANIAETKKINELASKIRLSILVESVQTIAYLDKNLRSETDVYVKIDTGYHRTGIGSTAINEIQNVVEKVRLSSHLRFKGFLTHAGNTYHAKSVAEILEISRHSIRQMVNLKNIFQKSYPRLMISTGDTPSCSLETDFSGTDEIRPGNFVFYDFMQYRLHSCSLEQIAIMMACPVVAKHPERNELVVYGGAVHFSKEFILNEDSTRNYGQMVDFDGKNWPSSLEDAYLSDISQEHGIVKCSDAVFQKYEPGDIVGFFPIHSCLTANLMGLYHTTANHIIRRMELSY